MLLIYTAACPGWAATELNVTFGGKQQVITTSRRPKLVVGSLADLQREYKLVQHVLPSSPVRFDGVWILPSEEDALRFYRDDPEKVELFSPSGTYVVRFRLTDTGPALASEIELAKTEGTSQWTVASGPLPIAVTNDGCVICQDGTRQAPAALARFDAQGAHPLDAGRVTSGPWGTAAIWDLVTDVLHPWIILNTPYRQLSMSCEGKVMWQRALAGDTAIPRFGLLARDPLKRGLYAATVRNEGKWCIEIVDISDGHVIKTLWDESLLKPPHTFSQTGQHALCLEGVDLAAIDWTSGEVVARQRNFVHTPPPVFKRWGTNAVSDDPLYIVTRTRDDYSTTTVRDSSGRTVWRCTTDIPFVQHEIASNGSIINLLSVSSDLQTVEGMLVFELTNRR
ncbi:MAG: hypothetical protein ACYC63_10890 [Armatimonadota bacterium]